MISAALGMVIMSAATVSMLIALDITTKELKKAGKYYTIPEEEKILERANFQPSEIESIKEAIELIDFGEIIN